MTVFRRAGATVSISATTTSANSAIVGDPQAVQVHNTGTTLAFIAFGTAAGLAATTADIPLPGGATLYLHKAGATYIAALMASGTATIYACPGDAK